MYGADPEKKKFFRVNTLTSTNHTTCNYFVKVFRKCFFETSPDSLAIEISGVFRILRRPLTGIY